MENVSLKSEKVTVYLLGDFMANVQKIECTKWDVLTRPYAQYKNAVQTTFVPKGKRNARCKIEGYRPYTLVLAGWGHPGPDSPFVTVNADKVAGVEVQQSKYLAHSEGYAQDFNARIDAYIAATGTKVLADHRYNREIKEVA